MRFGIGTKEGEKVREKRYYCKKREINNVDDSHGFVASMDWWHAIYSTAQDTREREREREGESVF